MRKTRITAFILALVSMCLFGLLLFPQATEKEEEKSEPMVSVVAAAKDIQCYSVVNQSMLTVVSVPQSTVHPNACLSTEEVIGGIFTADIAAGEIILNNHVLTGDEIPSHLVLCIPEGHRAMTIGVSDTTGVANLLKVGDRVDIISVIGLDSDSDKESQGRVAITLVQDKEILAIGQSLVDAPKADDGSYSYRNVTLALLPTEVPQVVAAQAEGELYCVLRPLGDDSKPDIKPFSIKKAY